MGKGTPAAGGIYTKARYIESGQIPNASAVVVDVSWRQIAPSEGQIDLTNTDTFDPSLKSDPRLYESWNTQIASGRPFWVRMFTSHQNWFPDWVVSKCHVTPIGEDHPERHMPIWNVCVWEQLRDRCPTRRCSGSQKQRSVRDDVCTRVVRWAEYSLSTVESREPRPNR